MRARFLTALLAATCALCLSASLASAQSPAPSGHPGDGVSDPAGRIAFGKIVRFDDFFGQVVAL
jgi:hypothetical protein